MLGYNTHEPNVFCLLNLNHWFKITQLNIKVLLFQNAAHTLYLNWVSVNLIIMIKLSIDTTAQNAMERLRYSWSIVLLKILNNIMKVKQLRTEYVQVWSVSRCLLLGEKKIPQMLNHCFPTVNVFLEGDRAGSCKISAMGPEFLVTALSAIAVSGSSPVYHLVFTPILPFPYCNPIEEFFSTWRWKVFNRLLTNKSLFSRPYMMPACPMTGLYLPYQKFFPRYLANEKIYYDVNENLLPNPQDRVDKTIEVQWGTLQLTFYCRPTVVLSSFFLSKVFAFLKNLLFWLFRQ